MNNQQKGLTKSGVQLRDGKIEGYAVVFWNGTPETEYYLNENTVERVDPNCVITFADDVFCTFDHDRSNYIARSSNGTLTLSIDRKGVRYIADVPSTSAGNDLKALASRPGDIAGSSFEFFLGPGESKYKITRENDLIIQNLVILKIHAVNPVFSPAYKGSVRKRSEDDIQAFLELEAKLKKIMEVPKTSGHHQQVDTLLKTIIRF